MQDDREPGAWPTLTRKIEPLPGGLAALQRRLAEPSARRAPRLFAFAALATACVLAMALWQARAPRHLMTESPRVADARVPASDRVLFFWVSATTVTDTHPVDPESLVAMRE
jgi:hypothetical protein